MIKRSRLWLTITILIICAAFAGLYASVRLSAPAHIAKPAARREDNPANRRAIDSAIQLLRDGDLALRTGADVISVMLRQMNLKDKTYSHCGIVMIEDGYPFVYHSIGGEDNPDARLQRDSAAFFFSPVSNERLGIARLDILPSHVRALHQITKRHYAAGVGFDMDFDMLTDDKLYCAEFVYKAVQEALKDTSYFSMSNLLQRSFVGVDNLTDPSHAKIVCDVRYKL